MPNVGESGIFHIYIDKSGQFENIPGGHFVFKREFDERTLWNTIHFARSLHCSEIPIQMIPLLAIKRVPEMAMIVSEGNLHPPSKSVIQGFQEVLRVQAIVPLKKLAKAPSFSQRMIHIKAF
jgi:hypothetical protein